MMKFQLCALAVLCFVACTDAFYGGGRRTRAPRRTTPAFRATQAPVTQTDPWPRQTEPQRVVDPWPQETQRPVDPAPRQTTDPWPRTTDPWPVERTDAPTTIPARIFGRDECQQAIANDDCQAFYTCFFITQQACEIDDADMLESLVNICVQSENVQDDNKFNAIGNRYISEYRKCSQRRILQVVDSDTCDEINDKAEEILVTEDTIWDCLYQNHTLCDVIRNDGNSAAIGEVLTGTGRINFRVYKHLIGRVESQCSGQGRRFARNFGKAFTSQMQNSMQMTMMAMMGGNGGD